MAFLHPWALFVGLAAVGLPVLVHWLTKPRPRRLPLSTIRFVRDAVRQRRARYRLRDVIILLLRAAAVCLLAWAFARPLIGARPLQAAAPGDSVRIVILDRSQSMAAVSGGIEAFERGRAEAARHLAYAPGLSSNLILAGAKALPVFAGPGANFTAMTEALAAAKPRSEGLNLKSAIESAAEMLGQAPQGAGKELVVVSDFQRSNWASVDFSPLPKETQIQLHSVAPALAPANLAILRVGARGRVEQGRESRLEVDVGNYSLAPRDVQVQVTVGGASLRLAGHCPPAAKTTLSGDVVLPKAGWQAGEAKLVDAKDALPEDDARPFVLEARPAPTFALMSREPARPEPTSSHFLELALAPTKLREGQPGRAERVVRLDPAALDRDAASAADLIVLDHPGRVPVESLKLLASLLRRGKPVLYVASEPADANNLADLADAAGSDLKMPVQFAPPAGGQSRRDLFIASFRRDSPVFAQFGDGVNAAVAPLRFSGGLVSRRLESGLVDEVLATYSDQSAALVVTDCGAGTLAVLNASLAESNLPGSPVFVPMVGELAGRLLSHGRGDEATPSGGLSVAYLPPDAGSADGLTVVPPAGLSPSDIADTGAMADEGGAVAWRWNAAGPPGVYTVRRGQADMFALAAVIPAAESDLQSIDPDLLKGRLAGGRTVSFQLAGEDENPRDTRWAWIAVACATCMLLELVALRGFKS